MHNAGKEKMKYMHKVQYAIIDADVFGLVF